MDIHGYPHKNDMDMDMDMDGIFLIHGKPAPDPKPLPSLATLAPNSQTRLFRLRAA